MPSGSMTFRVTTDLRDVQVTHIDGTDEKGINLYVCEFNDSGEQVKSLMNISIDEFKTNNPDMFASMSS